jgi:very-short-patch-repair endonuclease
MRGNNRLLNFSKKLRRNMTDAERYLWRYLRNRQLEGYKFRRQQVIENYIVDFVNFEKKIIIEVDGGQHNIYRMKDMERDRKLKELGFKVIRFWDNDVLNNIEGVLEKIREEILSPDT